MKRAAALWFFALACRPFEPPLCEACVDQCGRGLTCEEGVCVSPRERCEIGCGSGPSCTDGYECFEGSCVPPAQIALGGYHACVRWSSGRVSCWGGNRDGAASSLEERLLAPVDVKGLDAIDLTAGLYHTCAIRRGGEAVCWGSDAENALGNYRRPSDERPSAVFDLTAAEDIEAGPHWNCALTDGDELRCWGLGGCLVGEATISSSDVPLTVSKGIAIDQLTLASNAGFFLSNGEIFRWGDEDWDRCAPRSWWMPRARRIAAGYHDLYALLEDGTVLHRAIGDLEGTTTSRVPLLERAIDIAARGWVGCALLESGTVRCWGDLDRVGLGYQIANERTVGVPVQVPDTNGSDRIAVGFEGLGCVRKSDGVHCWGFNNTGQAGNGRDGISTPMRHDDPAAQVSAGDFHTCTLDQYGRARCWGANSWGEIGLGFVSPFESPRPVFPEEQFDEISAGGVHTCARTLDGRVYCWGWVADSIEAPAPIALEGARAISSGSAHTCAVLENGGVKCWGRTDSGQLGFARPGASREPIAISGIAAAKQIACSMVFCCVLGERGVPTCFGSNDRGRATGDAGDGPLIEAAPIEVPGAIEVTAGIEHACARRGDGAVFCWGLNNYGTLGDGTKVSRTRPVAVKGLTDAVSISSFAFHTCAVRRSGEAVCWGQDLNGRFGRGSSREIEVAPVTVPIPVPVESIDCGRDMCCALTSQNELWCFGYDEYGQTSGRAASPGSAMRVVDL